MATVCATKPWRSAAESTSVNPKIFARPVSKLCVKWWSPVSALHCCPSSRWNRRSDRSEVSPFGDSPIRRRPAPSARCGASPAPVPRSSPRYATSWIGSWRARLKVRDSGMAKRRPAARRTPASRSVRNADWAFHADDGRLGLEELGAQLAARIVADGRPVILVAHSMGGLVARMAVRMLPRRWVRRLIMLGTPNEGSFAAVQALRGTYPFVRRMSRLDHKHSAEHLAAKVFGTFPGLYHMLPLRRLEGVDLLDPRDWPADGPTPNAQILGQVAAVRAALAPADSRMVHIVGVDQETAIGMRRTAAGFEYDMTRNGDGTVPLALARLPKLKTYFVEELHGNLANNARVIPAIIDLVRRGRTRQLPGRWRARPGPVQRTDNTQLRLA